MTRSSEGTIPTGMTLYTFDYPDYCAAGPIGAKSPVWPGQSFLESDAAAATYATNTGALRATNVLTGRVIRPIPR